MKYCFFIIILNFLFNYLVSGQTETRIYPPSPRAYFSKYTVVDSGNIRVSYLLNALGENEYEDLQILEISDNISKYYSYIVFRSDSLISDFRKKNPKAQTIPTRKMNEDGIIRPYWSVSFKDFSKKIFTEYARTAGSLPNYQYDEEIHLQNWEIHDDTISIINYLCQKATCHFRGRDYTAWFSMDIPINNGPWKFGGLPGLIMKIYDNDEKFVFECIGIENRKFTILKDDYSEYNKTSRKNVLKLQNNIWDDFFKTAGIDWNGKILSKQKKKSAYNTFLLELE